MKFLTEKIIDTFPFCEKYVTNKKARTELFLRLGLAVNLAYALYNLITGVYYGSVWFGAVAVYYILLCTVKFFLLLRGFEPERKPLRALRDMRVCGILLILLNLTISVLIYRMIRQNSVHLYNGGVIFGAAGYTIFRIGAAVVDSQSLKKHFDPTIFAAKALSLSVALMSSFSLQTSLLDRFCDDSELKWVLNLFTGTGVAITVMAAALRTLLRANKELKKQTNDK